MVRCEGRPVGMGTGAEAPEVIISGFKGECVGGRGRGSSSGGGRDRGRESAIWGVSGRGKFGGSCEGVSVVEGVPPGVVVSPGDGDGRGTIYGTGRESAVGVGERVPGEVVTQGDGGLRCTIREGCRRSFGGRWRARSDGRGRASVRGER